MKPGNYFTIVREPHDDEQYVMTTYERHSSHCTQCVNPLKIQGAGQTLCGRGHKYARDVADYLFAQNGKHFSVVAREKGRLIQIKTPSNAFAVRSLLAAIEDGLHLYSRKAITGAHPYPIHPRHPAINQIQPRNQPLVLKTYEIIERKPQSAQPVASLRHSLRRYPDHRSLYIIDRKGRLESQREHSRTYLLYPKERV